MSPCAAARRRRESRRVGLARRVRPAARRRSRAICSSASLADVEVVDLRVARERVEVEGLQRRQPVLVERRGRAPGRPEALAPVPARRPALRRAPAGGAPARRRLAPPRPPRPPAPPAPRNRWTMSVISSCGRAISSARSGTDGNVGARRGRDRRAADAGGTVGDGAVGRHHLVAQERRVALQRRVHLLERQAHPPGEQRVVAVVEGEPLGEAARAARRPPPARAPPRPCRRAARRPSSAPREAGLEPRLRPRDLRVTA